MSFMKYLHPLWKTRLTKDSNPHNVVLASLDDMLKSVATDAMDSKKDARLETATGQWLDEFGDKFGVFRKDNESDDTYRQRIINFILIERGTVISIEDAIKKYLNDPTTKVEIYEPYKNVFILNKSKLNGEDHLLGKYYTTAVIDARFTENVPLDVLSEIEKFKPAGVKAQLSRLPNRKNEDATPIEKKIINSRNLLVKTKDYSGNDDPWSYNPSNTQVMTKRYMGTKMVQTNLNWGSIRYNIPSIVSRGAVKVGDTVTYSQSVRLTNNSIVNGNFATGVLSPFTISGGNNLKIEQDASYGSVATLRATGLTGNNYHGMRQNLTEGNLTKIEVGQKYRVRFLYRINSDITIDEGAAVEIKGTTTGGASANPLPIQEILDKSQVGRWVEFSKDMTATATVDNPAIILWLRRNGSISFFDIELTRLDTIVPMPIKFFADGSSMGGTVVGNATANWQMLSVTLPIEQNLLNNNGKLRFEVDQLTGTGNWFQTAAQTLVKGDKPLMYTEAPEDTGKNTADFDIQDKIKQLFDSRDKTYLRLVDYDIIGYKRVDRIIPVKPVLGTPVKPYPTLVYGGVSYYMVPIDKIKAEDATMLYYQTTIKGGTFENKKYMRRDIDVIPTFSNGYKDMHLPSELTKEGSIQVFETFKTFTKNKVLYSGAVNVFPRLPSDNDRPATETTRGINVQTFWNQDYLGMTCTRFNDSAFQLGSYESGLQGFKLGDKVTLSADVNCDISGAYLSFWFNDGKNWIEYSRDFTTEINKWVRLNHTQTIPANALLCMWRIYFPRVEAALDKKLRIKNVCINKGDPIPYEDGNSTQKRGDNLDIVEEFIIDIKNK
ncbi:morphogenesis protein [Bacillus phage vB_BcgM]|nr:morphogenesis protein [Bacillus phage vB_BcgM]